MFLGAGEEVFEKERWKIYIYIYNECIAAAASAKKAFGQSNAQKAQFTTCDNSLAFVWI